MNEIVVRKLEKDDIPTIVKAFEESKWTIKPKSLFEKYALEQQNNEREIWLAFIGEQFCGYVTLLWSSIYPGFKANGIPEIMDLNVLPRYRRKGIATKLMQKVEHQAAQNAKQSIGIGVGLYPDYGPAQKLYVKRGFVPDGKGATYQYKATTPGNHYPLDDDFVLWFLKNLSHTRL